MKLGLAILPMDVWADVFVYPWISRQKLAQIVVRFKERAFAEKLQTFLHDPKCGKHSLRFLEISCKPNCKMSPSRYELRKRKTPQYQASFSVATNAFYFRTYTDFEFPESEMPENITSFKQLAFAHLDDEVLAFLHKIKPLFTDVFLKILIRTTNSYLDARIFFSHLLPMIASIRTICCLNEHIELLEQHFSGTLAMAKKLYLFHDDKPACIPAYLNWLNKPQEFAADESRFLKALVKPENTLSIVDAVRKQFMTAATSATFVIFLQFTRWEEHIRVDEFNIEKAATNEQLTVRNAIWKEPQWRNKHYVEILRHPRGADAIMRDWAAYYEYKAGDVEGLDDGKQIHIIKQPTIGRITKKAADETKQDEDKSAEKHQNEDKAGPSTSANKMKK